KLYLADINYGIISPIDLTGMGVTKLELSKEVNNARELQLQFNTYLDEAFDYLLLPETKLVLEIDGYKVGFSKDNNIITDLLCYANIGAGSDFNASVRLDTANTIEQESDFPITTEYIEDINGFRASFVSNNQANFQNKYYRTKVFNFGNLQESNISNLAQAQQRLYNEACNFITENQERTSIDGQIKRQNGVVDLKFYSSSFNLNFSKRRVVCNQDYRGKVSTLLNQIDPDVVFDVIDDIDISINTGTYSNFELLNEITKHRSLSWREVGLVNTQAGLKTRIQVGDLDKLPPQHLASNLRHDDWFDDNSIRITSVRQLYPSLDVELEVDKFILEGDNILINYKEYTENNDGSKREIFNFEKVQNFKSSKLDLSKLL
ncbi:MAG: hypothetical protein ACRDBG_23940, partial [Waterburya sp.]